MADITYRLSSDCPACGSGELVHLTASRPQARPNTESSAIWCCTRCRTEWMIEVKLTAISEIKARHRVAVETMERHIDAVDASNQPPVQINRHAEFSPLVLAADAARNGGTP